MPGLRKLFVDHPRSVGESYFEHCSHALAYGGRLGAAALTCVVHAFVPGLFPKTASGVVLGMADELGGRRAKSDGGGPACSE